MNKWVLCFTFFIFFQKNAFSSVPTDTIQVTNIESLWSMAIENNPTQKVYQLKKIQAGYDNTASDGFRYPQAGFSYNGQDNLKLSTTPIPGALVGQPGKTIFLQFGKQYTHNSGLTVSYNLFDWQLVLQSKIAKENISLIGLQQNAFIQTLKTQLGQSYFALLIADASLQISKKDLILADSVMQITNQRFQQGVTDASSVNQAAINYNNVKQNTFQSTELYKQALANIKILTGYPVETGFSFKESISLDSLTEMKYTQIGEDKNLLVYPYNIKLAGLQKDLQQAAYYPKVGLTGYLGYQQFRDDFGMSFGNGAWKDYQYVGVNFSWNLFTGFTNNNKLKSVSVTGKIAQKQYESALTENKINDAALLDSYTDYWNITNTAKKTYFLYGRNAELSLQKYKEGLISMDAYLKTFEDYLHAENAYLNNLSTLLSVQATILARN